jgi:hypothetical protein
MKIKQSATKIYRIYITDYKKYGENVIENGSRYHFKQDETTVLQTTLMITRTATQHK